MLRAAIAVGLGAFAVPAAVAQSFNIEFGPADRAPTPSYGAAGLFGAWNTLGVLPAYQRSGALVNLRGLGTRARTFMYGPTEIVSFDSGPTESPDEALTDDMLLEIGRAHV